MKAPTQLRRAVVKAGLWVVLFAGGAGSTKGIVEAGHKVDIAINHSPVALAVHAANHPTTRHIVTDVWDVVPATAADGSPVYGLWASPDCRDFSVAKGGKPRDKKIRSLAWSVTRWCRPGPAQPQVVFVENVREFAGWGPLLPNGKPGKWRTEPERASRVFRAASPHINDAGVGWVYIAGAYDREKLVFVKIGYTNGKNPNKRVRQIAQGVPHRVELLAAISGTRTLEAEYHQEFYKSSVRGEWFEPSPDLLCRVETINSRGDRWRLHWGKVRKK